VAYGIFQVPGGLLGDRFGGRHLLTILVLSWSLLTGAVALTAFLPAGGWLPFAFLLGVRFLFGAVQAGGFPALARVLTDWMPAPQRGLAQGMVWTFSRLGGAVAPPLFLLLLRLSGDWAPPFGILAGLGVLWCAAFWPWFRNRPEEIKQVNAAERELIAGRPLNPMLPDAEAERKWRSQTGVSDRSGVRPETTFGATAAAANDPRPVTSVAAAPLPWARFLGSRNVWMLCLMYGFVGFTGNFFTSTLLPVYLKDHRHMSGEDTAWASGLPLAFGIVSCLSGGVLSDWLIRRTGSRKWGRRLVGAVCLALGALLLLSVVWVEDVWLHALLLSTIFFLNDACMGPAWAACADVGERYAGTVSGAMNMTGAFLGAAGMALAGAFLKRGWDVRMFVMFACSYVFASLCWLAIDVTKPLVPNINFDRRESS
jgi:MFS family permease